MKRWQILERFNLGGAGSGHHGHKGIPGHRGGSAASGGEHNASDISSYEAIYGRTSPEYWDFSPDWGLAPGEYIGYRGADFHGGASKSGITYFAPEPTSASFYNEDVRQYKLTLENPKIAETKGTLVKELFGKSFQDMLYSIDRRKHDTVASNRELENRIAKKLKSQGYDSLVVKKSQPPTVREIGIIGGNFEVQ